MYWKSRVFHLPSVQGKRWHLFANTGTTEINWTGYEPLLGDQERILLEPRSVLVLVGR
jgi:hypothetical protein